MEDGFSTQKEAVSEYEAILGGEYDFASEYPRSVEVVKVKPGGGISNARTVRKMMVRRERGDSFQPLGDRRNPNGDIDFALEYGAVENTNKNRGGWSPMVWKNGVMMSPSWSSTGYDKDEAIAMAKESAHDEADHYTGDWEITIGERKENPYGSFARGGSLPPSDKYESAKGMTMEEYYAQQDAKEKEAREHGYPPRAMVANPTDRGPFKIEQEGLSKWAIWEDVGDGWQYVTGSFESQKEAGDLIRRWGGRIVKNNVKNNGKNEQFILDRFYEMHPGTDRRTLREMAAILESKLRYLPHISQEEAKKSIAKLRRQNLSNQTAVDVASYLRQALINEERGGSRSKSRKNPLEPSSIEGVAKALWIPAWADYQVEIDGEDPGPGGDWVDIAPEVPDDVMNRARDYIHRLESANSKSMVALLMDASRADGVSGDELDDEYAEDFGYYITMQGLGHGVGWEDDHASFPITVRTGRFHQRARGRALRHIAGRNSHSAPRSPRRACLPTSRSCIA
jgi:hypothetical protein